MIVGRDIIISNDIVPLVRAKTVLTASMIDLMRLHNIRFAYILTDLGHRMSATQDAEISHSIHIPQSKPVVSAMLRDTAVHNLEDIFHSFSMDTEDIRYTSTIVRQLDQIIDEIVDNVDSHTLINIMNLKCHDDYTYHHSLSVTVLSLAIAKELGMGRNELKRIGTCAMMHDIGKTAVPVDLIKKTNRLDDNEMIIMRGHSKFGYEYLAKSAIGDEEVWRAVLHHHERVDGTGYPYRLKGREIPLWSRIVSVADVYDALTSNRPYRSPLQPAEAVEYIMGGTENHFDFDVVEAFVNKLEIYPLGSKVKLSTGQIAVVYNNTYAMRPVVRLVPTGELLDLYRDRACLSMVITELLPS